MKILRALSGTAAFIGVVATMWFVFFVALP